MCFQFFSDCCVVVVVVMRLRVSTSIVIVDLVAALGGVDDTVLRIHTVS